MAAELRRAFSRGSRSGMTAWDAGCSQHGMLTAWDGDSVGCSRLSWDVDAEPPSWLAAPRAPHLAAPLTLHG